MPSGRESTEPPNFCSMTFVYCTIFIAINLDGNSRESGGTLTADYSSFGLQDKIAIVTGPSQGIGRALALGLAQAGAHVVLAKYPGGREEEIRQVQAEIEAWACWAVAEADRIDPTRRHVESQGVDHVVVE